MNPVVQNIASTGTPNDAEVMESSSASLLSMSRRHLVNGHEDDSLQNLSKIILVSLFSRCSLE